MTDAFDQLMSWASQRGHYGKQYDSAKTTNDLMVSLSEALMFSAVSIVQTLRPPKRGRLILWIMKKISRSSYEHFLGTTNGLYVHTILYLTYE